MRFSPRVEALQGPGAAAWEIHSRAVADRAAGADVVLMSIGDPDLDTPAPVVDRAVAGLRAGETHYAPIRGLFDLRERIAARFRAEGGPADTGPENVVVLAGAQNGLFAAAQLLFAPGDEVLLPDPAYVTYDATLRAAGAEPVRIAPRTDAPFRPDPAAMAAAVGPATRGILLNTPANPTGIAMTREELGAIAAIAWEADLVVMVDEVYARLCFDRPHVPFAGLPGMAERTVTIGSLSKSHAMTGWRVGWAIGPEAFATHAERLGLAMLYGLPAFTQNAAATALERAGEIEPALRETFRRRCAVVADALAGVAGLSVIRPEGGMFVMVDVTASGLDSGTFVRRLYEAEGVSTLDGAAFGPSAAGTIRVSCAIGEAALAEGARRIARFAEAAAREAA